VFEDGQLTDGLGNMVDFKNTIIIMTSNLGARFLDKKSQLGFASPNQAVPAKIEDQVMGEVKRAFNPEFLNRLDEVILFTSLLDEDLLKIVWLLVDQINVNLGTKQIKIHLREDAAKYILEKTCGDRSYGARPLRRALQKYIEDPSFRVPCPGPRSLKSIWAMPAFCAGRSAARAPRWRRPLAPAAMRAVRSRRCTLFRPGSPFLTIPPCRIHPIRGNMFL
jgi:hypothetical protein